MPDMPVVPARQAAALWAPDPLAEKYTAMAMRPRMEPLPPGGIAAIPRIGSGAPSYGGLNNMSLGPYFDPRTATLRAPVVDSTPAGDPASTLPSGASFLRYGPAEYRPEDYVQRPKTQFAAHGKIDMIDPIPACVYDGCCVCFPCRINMYSMTALLIDVRNAYRVRDMLEAEGVITVSEALRASRPLCACRVLGGPCLYDGLLRFALAYEDVPIVQVPNPAQQLHMLDRLYVDNVLGSIRTQVNANARMNYARAEGPRAYLQDLPVADDSEDTASEGLPCVLPGTGVRVVPTDSLFTTRALTDPRSSARNRAALSAETGLPIGATPCIVSEQILVPAVVEIPGCGAKPSPPRAFEL